MKLIKLPCQPQGSHVAQIVIEMAEAATRALELHLHPAELSNILGARQQKNAPIILRRNLSYVESDRRALHQETGQVLHLELHATNAGMQAAADTAANVQPPAEGSSTPAVGTSSVNTAMDVIIAALSVVMCSSNGSEVFVPIAVRAMPVLTLAKESMLAVDLPLVPLAGTSNPAAGLAVVLIHQRGTRLATLVSMACCRHGTRDQLQGTAAAAPSALLHLTDMQCQAYGMSAAELRHKNHQAVEAMHGSEAAAPATDPVPDLAGAAEQEREVAATAQQAAAKHAGPGVGKHESRAGKDGSSSGNDSNGDSSGGSQGCKVVTPSITADSAFQLLPSGSAVAYSIVHLGELRGGGSKQQGPLTKLDGVLATREPPPAGANGSVAPSAVPFPWIEFQSAPPERENGSQANGSGSSSSWAQFWYSIFIGPAGSCSNRADGTPGERPQGTSLAGTKRKASELAQEVKPGAASRRQHLHQNGYTPQEQQLQQGAALPPASEQPQPQPLLTFYFCSFDGSRTLRAQGRGFCCPLASCRGLRCHSYAALQQHMRASHSYQSCYFSDAMPGGQLEVYLRCKPAWCDGQGGFLPRQLGVASLEAHPLSTLLARTHILRPLIYHCPRAQRHLRLGHNGQYPRDEEEERLEQEAEEAMAVYLAEDEVAAAEDPGSSAPLTSSPGVTTTTAGASGASGPAANKQRQQQHAGAALLAPAAAAQRAKAGGQGRVRKGSAPAWRKSQGLSLLNHEGRVKFYHSRTCVAMTRQELFAPGGVDTSESESDLIEWQRDCRERLKEQSRLCYEEHDFMFEWNLFVHKQPLYADADLPAAVQQFAAAHSERLAQDGPFRRCLLSYLLNLWRFRLLTPNQLHELTRGLPAV